MLRCNKLAPFFFHTIAKRKSSFFYGSTPTPTTNPQPKFQKEDPGPIFFSFWKVGGALSNESSGRDRNNFETQFNLIFFRLKIYIFREYYSYFFRGTS